MRAFDWQDHLQLGIAAMDREHQQLTALMNRLYDRSRRGASHIELRGILAELAHATREHFVNEERYLEAIGYEEIERHKAVHTALLESFEEHRHRFVQAGGGIPRELFSFLRLWLEAHIDGLDRKYADYELARRRGALGS